MNRKSIMTLIIATIVSVNTFAMNVQANDSIQDQIDANKDKINELQQEKEELENNISIETESLEELNGEIETKRNEIGNLQAEIDGYQGSIDLVQGEIDTILIDINDKMEIIENQRLEIEALEAKEKETKKMLENRLVMYYKMDITTNMIYVLIKSESLTEFFNNLSNINKIMNTDKAIIERTRENNDKIKAKKEEMELEVAELEEEKLLVESKQKELLDSQYEFISAKEKEREGLNYLYSLENAKVDIINSLENQTNNLQGQISDLNSFNAELQAQLDAIMDGANDNNSGSQDNEGEGFLRPTPGPITCPFGPRIDPISGAQGYHKGVDFGDWYSTPIKATKSGTVEYSGWIEGYGNCVIINHGNGVQSLYAHAEELFVSYGQKVEQGETIAAVGTTGYSTGPHLHFEIRFDGVPVDPMGYL